MVRMLVRDENRVDLIGTLADRLQPGEGFFPAEACVDEDARAFRADEGAVAGARAGQHAELYDSVLLKTLAYGIAALDTMVLLMKARVYVSLKPTVLDPQGQTIRSALNGLGHKSIVDVRQGKYFDIAIDPSAPRDQTVSEIETIAQDVLSNPVIEEYRVEILE